jgi:hypothetical protein
MVAKDKGFFEKQGFKGSVKRGFVKYRSAFSSAE